MHCVVKVIALLECEWAWGESTCTVSHVISIDKEQVSLWYVVESAYCKILFLCLFCTMRHSYLLFCVCFCVSFIFTLNTDEEQVSALIQNLLALTTGLVLEPHLCLYNLGCLLP